MSCVICFVACNVTFVINVSANVASRRIADVVLFFGGSRLVVSRNSPFNFVAIEWWRNPAPNTRATPSLASLYATKLKGLFRDTYVFGLKKYF